MTNTPDDYNDLDYQLGIKESFEKWLREYLAGQGFIKEYIHPFKYDLKDAFTYGIQLGREQSKVKLEEAVNVLKGCYLDLYKTRKKRVDNFLKSLEEDK